jgi:hypothetical protein
MVMTPGSLVSWPRLLGLLTPTSAYPLLLLLLPLLKAYVAACYAAVLLLLLLLLLLLQQLRLLSVYTGLLPVRFMPLLRL